MAVSTIKRQMMTTASAYGNADGNNFTNTGIYNIRNISANFPIGYGILLVMASSDGNIIQQVLFRPEAIYTRRYASDVWEDWKKVALTNA